MSYTIEFMDINKVRAYRYTRVIEVYLDGERVLFEDPIAGFYSNLELKEYPKFLNDSDKMAGGYPNEISFYKGPLKEGKLDISESEVVLNTYVGLKKIKINKFDLLNMQLANKALNAVTMFKLKERGIVNDDWIEAIKKWILSHELV